MRTLSELYDSIPENLLAAQHPLNAEQRKQIAGIEKLFSKFMSSITNTFSNKEPVNSG